MEEGKRLGTEPSRQDPPRASTPPAPTARRSWRVAFAAAWLVVQGALVATADRRADGAFGFRMFNESSVMKLALYRELDTPSGRARVHVEGGVWNARAADGTVRRFTWYDRVPMPFWVFDQDMPASYGVRAQLVRLQAALDDVAAHVPNDGETRRFVLEVVVRRNGREPAAHTLVSSERGGGA